MMEELHRWEKDKSGEENFPSLKEIYMRVAVNKLGTEEASLVQKEIKAAEQRVRRTIYQALTHLASLGLTDYSNPKFESYASTFFDFTEVRKRMRELESQTETAMSSTKINTKKFMFVLYMESKRRLG
jgi:two-component system response regulator YcbB